MDAIYIIVMQSVIYYSGLHTALIAVYLGTL